MGPRKIMNSYLIVSGKWSELQRSVYQSVPNGDFVSHFYDADYFLGSLSEYIYLSGDCVLHHPSYDPKECHFYIYDPALFDISRAAYVDVVRIMDSIQQLHVDGVKNSFRAVFVVGDQQTYD